MQELISIPILSEAPAEALARHRSALRWRSHSDGEMIVDHGDDSDDVVFVLSGRVRVLIISAGGRRVTLTEIGAGECFGELAAIDRGPRSASVMAIGPVKVCMMPGSVFREVATTCPKTALKVMETLAQRIRALNERHAEQTFLTAGQRLCAMLMRLSRPRASDPAQRVISPPPTHESLGDMIGCRREVVSREISALTKEGAIERARGGLIIKHAELLNARVAEAMGVQLAH